MWFMLQAIKRLLFLLVCVALLAGCAQKQINTATEATPQILKPTFETVTVTRDTFTWTEKVPLTFDYYNKRYVTSEYDGATITDIHGWQRGETVKAGDVLATVSFEADELELARMELEYDRMVLNMNNTISSYYQSIASIKGNDRISQLQRLSVEYQLSAYQTAEQQRREKALQEIEAYKLLFEPIDIVSPYDGVICSITNFYRNTVLSKGDILLTIADVDSAYYSAIHTPPEEPKDAADDVYQQVFLMGTPGCRTIIDEYDATLVSSPITAVGWIDGNINAPTYFRLDNLENVASVARKTAQVTLLELENMIVLPLRAVHDRDIQPYVNILENGTAVKRYVLCGPSNTTGICILDGLEEGLQVILN